MTGLKTDHRFVKFLLQNVRGPRKYKGNKLSVTDYLTVKGAFVLYACVLRDTCVEGCKANEGRLKEWVKSLHDADLYELLYALDFAADWLLQSVANESLRSYAQLKLALSQEGLLSKPVSQLLGLVKPHVLGWFHHRCESSFRNARTAFCYLSRIALQDDVSLAQPAYESWWEAENDLSRDYDFTGDEKMIISEWFPIENAALFYEWLSPHHGAGTSAEGVRNNGQKGLINGYDDNLLEFILIAGWDPDFSGLMQKPWFLPVPGSVTPPCTPSNRHKVMGVPKNWKTKRLVSEEPTAYMFWQLGASSSIQRMLKERVSSFWHHYCVDTDSENRELARLGSIDGSFATIDLSHASDSVSFDLIAEWFGESCLDAAVRHLRTSYAEFRLETPDFWGPDRVEDIIAVQKFAPMGSGLCFPIESITFGAMAESSVRHTKGARHNWRVFGDDIVIDVLAVPRLLGELRAKGFSPNMRKSFFNTSETSRDFFRESCGGEYLNGIDVTPKRISRKFNGLRLTSLRGSRRSRSIVQLVKLANDLYDLRTARMAIIHTLLAAKVPILFDTDGLRGIKSPEPTNHHLRHRWNQRYQRWEVKAVMLQQKRRIGSDYESFFSDEVRLFEYLRLAEQSHRKHLLYPEDMVSERMDPYSTELKLSYQWVDRPWHSNEAVL